MNIVFSENTGEYLNKKPAIAIEESKKQKIKEFSETLNNNAATTNTEEN